jgi:antitoxin (DNA-binding transcriptional repressor) of toxin-antitoxin stability system
VDTPPSEPVDRPTTVGIRELRASLATAARRAAAGERLVVAVGGRPIAQLGPLDAGAPTIAQLVSSGALVAPRRSDALRAPAPVAIWSGTRIDRALRELRG